MNDRAIKTQAAAARHRTRSVLLRLGGYDAAQMSPLGTHLRRMFSRLQINVVVDVGARRGEYGAWLRRIGYEGWIFSFEPVAESFAALERKTAGDGRWVARRLALGREAGSAEINVAEVTAFSSFLAPSSYAASTFGSAPRIAATETVPVQTLDAVFGELLADVRRPARLPQAGYPGMGSRGAPRRDRFPAPDPRPADGGLDAGHLRPDADDERLARVPRLDRVRRLGVRFVSFDNKLRAVELDCVAVHTELVPAHARTEGDAADGHS